MNLGEYNAYLQQLAASKAEVTIKKEVSTKAKRRKLISKTFKLKNKR